MFEYLRSLSMLPTFLRHEGILVTCDEAMFQRSVVVLRETRCEDETQDSDVCSVSTEVATENHGQVPTDQTFAWCVTTCDPQVTHINRNIQWEKLQVQLLITARTKNSPRKASTSISRHKSTIWQWNKNTSTPTDPEQQTKKTSQIHDSSQRNQTTPPDPTLI